jgi:serine/threonine protein kinase
MLQRYKTNCKCGNSIEVEFKIGSNGLQIYCQCGELLVEYLQDKAETVFDSLNTTFQAAEQENNQAAVKPGNKDITKEMTEQLGKTGRQFGEYSIIKELGKGGMGKVYLAHNNSNGEKLALKVLNKIDDAEMIRYFIREAQMLVELNHPNIVKIKGQGNHNRHPYIAMEYVIGKTLAELVAQNGPLRPVSVAQVTFYVLAALEYAAQKKIIHRDIKAAQYFRH